MPNSDSVKVRALKMTQILFLNALSAESADDISHFTSVVSLTEPVTYHQSLAAANGR